jgi:hypothetical protein
MSYLEIAALGRLPRRLPAQAAGTTRIQRGGFALEKCNPKKSGSFFRAVWNWLATAGCRRSALTVQSSLAAAAPDAIATMFFSVVAKETSLDKADPQRRRHLEATYCKEFIAGCEMFHAIEEDGPVSNPTLFAAHKRARSAIQPAFEDDMLDRLKKTDDAICRHFKIAQKDTEQAKDSISETYGGNRPSADARKMLSNFAIQEARVRTEVFLVHSYLFDGLDLKSSAIEQQHQQFEQALHARLDVAFTEVHSQYPNGNVFELVKETYTSSIKSLAYEDYPKGYLDTVASLAPGIAAQAIEDIQPKQAPPAHLDPSAATPNDGNGTTAGMDAPPAPSNAFRLSYQETGDATTKCFEALIEQHRKDIEAVTINGKWPSEAIQAFEEAYASDFADLCGYAARASASIRDLNIEALKAAARSAVTVGFMKAEVYHTQRAAFSDVLQTILRETIDEIDLLNHDVDATVNVLDAWSAHSVSPWTTEGEIPFKAGASYPPAHLASSFRQRISPTYLRQEKSC